MALILVEHEQHPDIATIIGLYELEEELHKITQTNNAKSFHLLEDFIKKLDFVQTYICNEDGVQIVKKQEIIWDTVCEELMNTLFQVLNYYDISLIDDSIDHLPTEIKEQMDQVLDAMIRPALASHAGNIDMIYLKKHIVAFKLLGSCQGCPFSLQTLTTHIAKILHLYFPNILLLHIKSEDDLLINV